MSRIKQVSIRQLSTIVVTISSVIVTVLLIFFQRNLTETFLFQQLVNTGEALISSSRQQVDSLIPGVVIQERAGGNEIILHDIKSFEALDSISILKSVSELPGPLRNCTMKEDGSQFCVNLAANTVSTITPIQYMGENLGYLVKDSGRRSSPANQILRGPMIATFLVLMILLVGIVVTFLVILEKSVRSPLESIRSSIESASVMVSGPIKEINELAENVYRLGDKLRKAEVHAEIGKVASQVAHDIRSPLVALSMIESDLTSMPEEQRIVLRSAVNRIRDIANNLLDQKKAHENAAITVTQEELSAERETVFVSTVIESLISEKRIRYRKLSQVEIEFQTPQIGYGLFASVQRTEFHRALSNLIDNAVESLVEAAGKVELQLSTDSHQLCIRISDTGKGMSTKVIEALFTTGGSFKKPSGHGLGFSHARNMFESWDGQISVESQIGIGTHIFCYLPLATPPHWFIDQISIHEKDILIILDDDQSIHDVWLRRLSRVGYSQQQLSHIKHFKGPIEFKFWCEENATLTANRLFLIDYELLGSKITGLDLIEALGIAQSSVLVTSRHEEPYVLNKVHTLNLKMIPKSVAPFVPIRLIDQSPKASFHPEPTL